MSMKEPNKQSEGGDYNYESRTYDDEQWVRLSDHENLLQLERDIAVDELKEKFKMEGEYGKRTPFQETVNTYIENRAVEIKEALTNN